LVSAAFQHTTNETTGTTQGLLAHLSKLTLTHDSVNYRDTASFPGKSGQETD